MVSARTWRWSAASARRSFRSRSRRSSRACSWRGLREVRTPSIRAWRRPWWPHALAPALVLALAGPAQPSWQALPIYVLALGSQFALDFAISVLRDLFVVGLGVDLALPLIAWSWLVDGVLATIGLLAALAARDAPFGALLVLPLICLLHVF